MRKFLKTGLIFLVVIMLLIQITTSACNEEKDKAKKCSNTGTSIEDRLNALMAGMTLDEKAGQMVQAEINVTPDDVKKYFM
jgi:nitrous oxide reductase accessory protein NosL